MRKWMSEHWMEVLLVAITALLLVELFVILDSADKMNLMSCLG